MTKKRNGIIALIIAAALVLTPVIAFSAQHEGSGEASLLQEGNYEIQGFSSQGAALLGASNVENYIYTQLKAHSSSFSLYSYNINKSNISSLISNVINDNPDLFFVSSSFDFSYYSNGRITTITPHYTMTSAQIEANTAIFDYGVNEAVSVVDPLASDMQKALVIHDYICDLATYPQLSSGTVFDADGNPTDDLDKDIYHSSFGFFFDRNIVCAGYTLAYSYLMHELGIECEYVSSDSMKHAWNKIKIDGAWYNADLTFDDFDYIQYDNTRGSVQHCFFLKSDSYFSSLSGYYHFDGKTYETCDATSTLYDDAFFNDVNSMIYVKDGYFYYLDPDFTNGWTYLTKRSQNGTETTVGNKLPAASVAFQPVVYDTNGNSHDAPFDDLLARLTYLDGRFYVAANMKLYSMTFEGARSLIKSDLEYYVVGLGVSGKNLVYNVYGESTHYELDKLQYFHNYISDVNRSVYNNYPDVDNNGYVNAKDYALIVS